MHPNLSEHLHADCTEIIRLFRQCHAEHPLKKFFGVCNDAKLAVDKCLTEEYLVARKKNFDEAMRKRRKFEEIKKEVAELQAELDAETKA